MDKIQLRDVNIFYGDFHAIHNISLNIVSNSITAFIGPSGCGKSTVLKTLNRMNDLIPTCKITGTITLDDENIYTYPSLEVLRQKVGMVFQKPNLFPMTIFENVAYGPKVLGIKNKKELAKIVQESLEKAAIWDEVKDRLHTPALRLSGGQQQRVCIARALAIKPEVLLMDEPTSALDPISTAKIEELLLELKKEYTIVLVTHNMQQAVRVSDYTAFFLLGELIEMNTTDELFRFPKQEKTEQYITGRFG